MKNLTSGFFAAALALALPLTANAQEAVTPEQEQCTATVTPIHAGEKVAATVTFVEPFGAVTELNAPEGTTLALAIEEDGERGEMAVEGEAEKAPMATENESKIWISAPDVAIGTYEVTLLNDAGESCTAEIVVEEKKTEAEKTEVENTEAENTEAENTEAEKTEADEGSDSDW